MKGNKRQMILEEAMKCVCKDRHDQYGNPESNFETIARMWEAYLSARGNICAIQGFDVAAMMSLLKIARIATGAGKDDNWIDLAGYAACGGEIQIIPVNEGND